MCILLTCDRQKDGHMVIANTMLALHHAGKIRDIDCL